MDLLIVRNLQPGIARTFPLKQLELLIAIPMALQINTQLLVPRNVKYAPFHFKFYKVPMRHLSMIAYVLPVITSKIEKMVHLKIALYAQQVAYVYKELKMWKV